jgi:hypothetical protein
MTPNCKLLLRVTLEVIKMELVSCVYPHCINQAMFVTETKITEIIYCNFKLPGPNIYIYLRCTLI